MTQRTNRPESADGSKQNTLFIDLEWEDVVDADWVEGVASNCLRRETSPQPGGGEVVLEERAIADGMCSDLP